MFEIKKNFLEKDEVNTMVKILTSYTFPWYFYDTTAYEKDKSNFLFSHVLFENNKINSNHFESILIPILNKLKLKKIIRAKLNFYTKREKQIKTQYHTDFKDNHTVALFSFNTNNGYTDFKNGKKIKSTKNQLGIFSGSLQHRSVNQTDKKYRINLNINF